MDDNIQGWDLEAQTVHPQQSRKGKICGDPHGYVADVVGTCGCSLLIAYVFCSDVGKRSCAKEEAQKKYRSFEDFEGNEVYYP